MREVLLLVAVSTLVGLPAAFELTRLLANQLYPITPNDPVILIAATLGIIADGDDLRISSRASCLPGDPIRALQYE
jgi:hypothetical protein